jgi:(p)ppGpp synthase/HD superfamily hydrolase
VLIAIGHPASQSNLLVAVAPHVDHIAVGRTDREPPGAPCPLGEGVNDLGGHSVPDRRLCDAPIRQQLAMAGRATSYGWSVDRVPSVEDAIALAARAHRGQRYPSPEQEPYIFHPLRVMLSVVKPGDQIVAVLHDVVEDTDLELRDLVEAGYRTEIVAAVDSLTHRDHESYDEYIGRVATNEVACRVKLADLRDNLANNRRLPTSPDNAERIARYGRALKRLGMLG